MNRVMNSSVTASVSPMSTLRVHQSIYEPRRTLVFVPVKQDTELEDGDTDDLRQWRVHNTARLVGKHGQLGLMHARALLSLPGRGVYGVGPVAENHAVGVLPFRRLWSMSRMRTGSMAVRIVRDTDRRELGGTPAEGDQLDNEDHEDAEHCDGQRIGLE